jgi:heme oxygenase
MNQLATPSGLSGVGTPGAAKVAETIPFDMATGGAAPALRLELRAATRQVHDRLHRHAGFAAIQAATIGLAEYQDLIVQLYGFYVPFEAAIAIEPDRSNWLAGDLEAMNLKRPLHALPKCAQIPRLGSTNSRLGALYVAE